MSSSNNSLSEEAKEKIALEVNRLSKENQDSFRTFLEKTIRHFIWLVTAITVIILAGLYFFFGDTSEKLNDKINEGVEQVVIENRVNKRIKTMIDSSIVAELREGLVNIDKMIKDSVTNVVDRNIPNLEARVQSIANNYINSRLSKVIEDEINRLENSKEDLKEILNLLPSGMIVAHQAISNTIPSGWVICDGNNGTPDLRGKFILGGDLTEIGKSGGSETHRHKHFKFNTNKDPIQEAITATYANSSYRLTEASNMPPFYTLVYLMKL